MCHEKPYDNRYKIEGEKFCGIENMDVNNYYCAYYNGLSVKPDWCPLKGITTKEIKEIGLY